MSCAGRIAATRCSRLAGALCCLLAVVAVPWPLRAKVVNRIVATIDGEPITLHEVRQFASQRARLLPGAHAAFDLAPVLDAYIIEKIIAKEVAQRGMVIRESDVDRYVETIAARNQLSPEALREAVAARGLAWKDYRQQVRREIEKAQLINVEIRGKVSVTPEDVERYYEAHKKEYATPSQFHLRHIVLRLSADAPAEEEQRVRAQAAQLYERLRQGADFAALARAYSEDAAAENGGDLGFVKRGEILSELEGVVVELEVGEVSKPVRTAVGIHLVKLEAKRAASYTPLAELANELKEKLYGAALEERYDRWLKEDLRRRHRVEVRP